MRRGFPYETSITSKKEGKIYVEGRILRSVTMSRDSNDPESVLNVRQDSSLALI